MALARTHAMALVGVQGHVVEIEADIENGLVALLLVGLPDTALREARDRIRSAIVNSQQPWPQRRITVGLAPASLPKRGSAFDIGIALAILAAAGSIRPSWLEGTVFLGELGLDGRLRPVPGVLPAAAAAAAAGFSRVVTPPENLAEAALVPGVQVVAPATLAALLDWLSGRRPAAGDAAVHVVAAGTGISALAASVTAGRERAGATGGQKIDLADVAGQPVARRAAEICAAGRHHLMLLGPPGTGKTLLAERIPTIMPPLTAADALEVSAIHSVAGALTPARPLLTAPPFSAPHHTASKAAIVGGGSSGIIKPGAASLAHLGCLFLDEAPEFDRDVLDALRQPLECGQVVIARSGVTARFPARFTLVLAANPCPCARTSASGGCTCSPLARRRYLARLSGPLLDRVDVKVELLPVSRAELLCDLRLAEPSAVVAARVAAARDRAARRLRGTGWRMNAEIPGSELRRSFRPSPGALAPLERAMDLGQVSARGADRIIRLSWTLADLAGADRPGLAEVGYALGLWLGVAQ